MKLSDLEIFTAAYIEALYFTDTGDDGQPATDTEIDAESLEDIRAECRVFWKRASAFVLTDNCQALYIGRTETIQAAAHDFWFTRNGHGVGFWDSSRWPKCYSETFTRWAENMGAAETYETDAGEIAIL